MGSNEVGQGPVVLGGGQAEGLLVMRDRLVHPSAAGQGEAEVVVGLRIVGLDFQGLPVMGDGLVDCPRPARAYPRLKWASA